MPNGAPLLEVRIYDASGRIVESNIPGDVEFFNLDLSNLNVGLHYITVRTIGGASSTQKLLVY